jgi:hypothetical protein
MKMSREKSEMISYISLTDFCKLRQWLALEGLEGMGAENV